MGFLFALLFVAQAPSQAPDTTHLVIVATTDVHGRALAWDYVRDAEATASCEVQYREKRATEAMLLSAQEAGRNVRSQLDTLRSINANHRQLVSGS